MAAEAVVVFPSSLVPALISGRRRADPSPPEALARVALLTGRPGQREASGAEAEAAITAAEEEEEALRAATAVSS
jgi:hypothetical protein